MVLIVESLGHTREPKGFRSHRLEIGNEAAYGDLLREFTCTYPIVSGEITGPQVSSPALPARSCWGISRPSEIPDRSLRMGNA